MTDETRLSGADIEQVQRGLRLSHPPDPVALAAEREQLAALEHAGVGARWSAYLKLHGPGYLQSAMTLGGGTAFASLYAGAVFGYSLLWVAPVSMLLGIIMLSAISYQTLSTGMRPFEAMRRYAGAPFAWGWAIGALVASVIWHFPQYALASSVLVDMADFVGIEGTQPGWMSFVVLALAVSLSGLYGGSDRMTRAYERILKYLVWGIVVCFGAVVAKTGISDWGALGKGFIGFEIPGTKNEVAGISVVMGGLAAAVGVNMVFLYPYSLLARGWGREHRRLARFDLGMGMFLPYALAASLMVIAAANTIQLDPAEAGKKIHPVAFASALQDVAGPTLARLVFNFGVLGMALSSITLHMLCTGFVCTELFGWEVGGRKYRLATLIPVPGVLGPILWSKYAAYLAIPTTIACGFLLPIAYVGFILLQRNKAYLGKDLPSGGKGLAWLGGMVFTTVFLTAFLIYYVYREFF